VAPALLLFLLGEAAVQHFDRALGGSAPFHNVNLFGSIGIASLTAPDRKVGLNPSLSCHLSKKC